MSVHLIATVIGVSGERRGVESDVLQRPRSAPSLSVAAKLCLRSLRRSPAALLFLLAARVFLLTAIGFILFPDSLTYVARWLGIGVGANLLLYLLTFAFIAVSFMLYARIVQLRRQMTLLVRHLALSNPLPPSTSPKADV